MARKQGRGGKRRKPVEQPCIRGTAGMVATGADGVRQRLLKLSDEAQGALGDWPDADGTGELRTLLLDVVEAAEADARRWQALAGRFEALAAGGAHLHMIEGELVAVVDEADVIDVVPVDGVSG